MKRDARLRALSSDHHHALVVARRARRAAEASAAEAERILAEVREAFAGEIGRHFDIEEQALLPALARAGETLLVSRTLAEHAAMRARVGDASASPGEILRVVGALLEDHVRFEERELFQVCQERLADDDLDAIGAAGGGAEASG